MAGQISLARRVALAALLLGAASAHADGPQVRPGWWEFRTSRFNVGNLPDISAQIQRQLASLPPETQRQLRQQMAAQGVHLSDDGTVRSCITAEMARSDNIYAGHSERNCRLANVDKSADTVRGRLVCTQPQGSADFETVVANPRQMTTRIHMHASQGEVSMETEARWLADQCPATRSQP